MTDPRDNPVAEAHGAFDDIDAAILAELAGLYTAIDPVPPGLVERIQFAMALDDLDVAVLRLVSETTVAVGARSDRGRIYTFAHEGVTLTVRVSTLSDETVRIDGWMAPPAAHRVVLRAGGTVLDRTADADGRLVFERAPAGPAQIFVRPAGDPGRPETTMASIEVVL